MSKNIVVLNAAQNFIDGFGAAFGEGIDTFFTRIVDSVTNAVIGMFTGIMNIINDFSIGFWEDPHIKALIYVSRWVFFIVLGISIVFLIKDMVEQSDRLDMKLVLSSLFRGYLFSTTSHYLGGFIFTFGQDFVIKLNLSIDPGAITETNIALVLDGGIGILLSLIVLTIASVIFFIMTLMNIAAILIHILSSFVYIPFIVRGDSSKFGEWITFSVSISLTYIFRYIFFLLGMILLLDANMIGFILILAIFSVEKVLQKFGYSSGTSQGLSKIANTAMMTANMTRSFMR